MAVCIFINMMVLETRLYIAFGSSMKSDGETYKRGTDLPAIIGMLMDSFRLDKYYSSPSYMDKLAGTKVFVITKKNATLNGAQNWKDNMKGFV